MSATWILISAFAIALFGYFISSRAVGKRNDAHLPPGPIGLPLIGNILQLRGSQHYLTFSRLRKLYGDLFHCSIFGRDIIVISSEKVARDLLDKRSTKFSGRPSAAGYSAMGLEFNTGFIGYTDTWRLHRRFYHEALRRDVVSRYHSVQLRQAHALIVNIAAQPEGYEKHLQTFSASVILSAIYGYEATQKDDALVTMVGHVDKLIAERVFSFEVLLASGLPFLLTTPTWVPDFGVKRALAFVREVVQKTTAAPFEYTQTALVSGLLSFSVLYNSQYYSRY